MTSRRDRDRRPGRRPPFRVPKPTVLIVCEGAVTEPEYFKTFIRVCRNPRVSIEVAAGTGVPLSVVRKAKDLKLNAARLARQERDENVMYDSVWCVYDVDDHPHHHEAREMACVNHIELAISNPCFELWLLLHFRECPGMRERAEIQSLLKQHDPAFDKHISHPSYQLEYETAAARAMRLDNAATKQGELGRNPSTQVYKLTERLRGE